MRLRLDRAVSLESGDLLCSLEGRKVGKVTSVVESRRAGGAIGLGYVKKAFAAPGQELRSVNSEGKGGNAEVVSEWEPPLA